MKNIIVISLFIASIAGQSVFGQGVLIQGTVWDGFTNPNAAERTANVNLSLLWGLSGFTPGVANIMSSVPTNATINSSTWLTASAWNAILSDPNFTLAGNGIVRSAANGAYSFTDPAPGLPIGTTITLFVIGFDGNYATPVLAMAAHSAVGWSSSFDYVATAQPGIPNTATVAPFGVAGIIPEPTSMALAGLGGLSLLLFRRKKGSPSNGSSRQSS